MCTDIAQFTKSTISRFGFNTAKYYVVKTSENNNSVTHIDITQSSGIADQHKISVPLCYLLCFYKVQYQTKIYIIIIL
jgi:hypothetical protein